MKRIISYIISFAAAAGIMLSCMPSSYAITDRYLEALKLSGKPCIEDIEATGDDKKITIPDDSEYLDEYKWMYTDAPYGDRVYVYQDPCTDYLRQQGTAVHGERVAVLAMHNGYYCLVRYYNGNDKVRTGWIPIKYLNDDYPTTPAHYTGYDGEHGSYWKKDSKFGIKSDECFPGTDVNYVEFGKVPKFTAMKIKYTITDANGVADPAGEYKLYLYDDGKWCEASSFEVEGVNVPAEISIYCSSPQKISKMAVLPSDEDKQAVSFELYATDILVYNSDFYY